MKSGKKWKSPKFQGAEDNELPGVQGRTANLLGTGRAGEPAAEIRRAGSAQFATAQLLDLLLRSQEDAWEN